MTFYENDVDTLIDQETLHRRIAAMGADITKAYAGRELTLVCVLKGSAFFCTELAKNIDLPLTIEFLGCSSYAGGTETTGEVRITLDLAKPVAGKNLLVVEDIIDTGLTMKFLLENLGARHPESLGVCTLLHKPARARTQIPIDHTGFVIEDRFVVGFGLDFGEKYRNLPFIGVMKGK